MGNVDSKTFSRIPNAVLTFGPGSQNVSDLERAQTFLDGLNDAAECINNSLELTSSFAKFLEAIKSYTGPVGTFVSIVSYLIGKADQLESKISELETNIDTSDVKASLLVLKNIVDVLQDQRTTPAQLLSEIGGAVREFIRLLSKFTGDSVLSIKYHQGAPLFVQLCALFKVVILFAKNTPDYNNPGLEKLVGEYQTVLDSFRIRCIRERCLSIYMFDPNAAALAVEGGSDNPKVLYENTLTHFPNYFDKTQRKWCESTEKVRLKYAKRPWFGKDSFEIYDEWDVRERNEITFKSVVLHKDEKAVFSTPFSNSELRSRAMYAYRVNVVQLMENYFNAANLLKT